MMASIGAAVGVTGYFQVMLRPIFAGNLYRGLYALPYHRQD